MSTSRPSKPRATIKDVARAAGISHATVSRYLNKSSYVSADAAAAIEVAIATVEYMPNRSARALVNQRTMSVAVIVREHPDMFFADPNLSNMVLGAHTGLTSRGYLMIMLIVDDEASARQVTEIVRGGFVDGAILLAMQDHDPVVTELHSAGIPIITASSPVAESLIPRVDTDNFAGTRAITKLLRETGRRSVAELAGPSSAPVSAIRHHGFVAAMGDEYDAMLVEEAQEWSFAAGEAAMARLLERTPSVDGVVAASDLLAAGALHALVAAGRRVPEDVGVVGFDDSPIATQTRPALSTVRQDATGTGQRLAQLLVDQIDGRDLAGHQEILSNEIIWRDSAG